MSLLPRRYVQFQHDQPEIWAAYEALGAAAATSGPLDAKTRELVKLAMAAAIRAETAVHSHTHRAIEAGATMEEIEQTIQLGVTTLGFPTMMIALTWARAAAANREASAES